MNVLAPPPDPYLQQARADTAHALADRMPPLVADLAAEVRRAGCTHEFADALAQWIIEIAVAGARIGLDIGYRVAKRAYRPGDGGTISKQRGDPK